jgi:hypothetical protein
MFRLYVIALPVVLLACAGTGFIEYKDVDEDGFSTEFDCNDNDASINPNADEICDEIDNNCDGAVDDVSAIDKATWYADTDGDGFGDSANALESCTAAEGLVADATDCDDSDPNLRPDDQDGDGFSSCDGDCDDSDALLRPDDQDGDGFSSCEGDCDDTDAGKSPEDRDGDGFTGCEGDCDDFDDTFFPADQSVEVFHSEYDRGADGYMDAITDFERIRDVDENLVYEEREYDADADGFVDEYSTELYTHDSDGNVLTHERDFTLASGFTRLITYSYSYDSEGRRVVESYTQDDGKDGKTNYAFVFEYIYGGQGVMLPSKYKLDNDGDGKYDTIRVWRYTFDSYGNVVESEYDNNGDGKFDSVSFYGLTYTSDGFLIQRLEQADWTYNGRIDGKALWEYAHDARGNITNERYTEYSCGDCSDADSITVWERTFDADDQMLSEMDRRDYGADGKVDWLAESQWTYNANGDVLIYWKNRDENVDGTYDFLTQRTYTYTANHYMQSQTYIEDIKNDGVLETKYTAESEFTWMCP